MKVQMLSRDQMILANDESSVLLDAWCSMVLNTSVCSIPLHENEMIKTEKSP